MKRYLVGGAVRDSLMNQPSYDCDYVWTGATESDMLARGFRKIDADFPVFLDESGNEHALARSERKSGKGYKGFECDFSPDITIEMDLMRRDFTINAMAMSDDGTIIDPFGGLKDLKSKTLRHTSDAFREDPVRVLRTARFLARWIDFTVDKKTVAFLEEMVQSGELDSLQPDRVWKETEKALKSRRPSRYFVFLEMIGALKIIFPEVSALRGVPQPFKYHPEGDCFSHTMEVLDQYSEMWTSPVGRFAALCHDLGKATTPKDILPSHHGHEMRGVHIINSMSERLPIPNEYADIAKNVAEFHTHIHNLDILKPSTIVKMFDRLCWKKHDGSIMSILPSVSEADSLGRTSFYADRDYPNWGLAMNIFGVLSLYKTSDHKPVEEIKTMKPEAIQQFNFRQKIKIVADILKIRVDDA